MLTELRLQNNLTNVQIDGEIRQALNITHDANVPQPSRNKFKSATPGEVPGWGMMSPSGGRSRRMP